MSTWRDRILAVGAIVVIAFIAFIVLGASSWLSVIIVFAFFALPILVLYIVALSRGRSGSWA